MKKAVKTSSGGFSFEIKKQSIVSEIAHKLMEYFTSGEIKPGDRLPSERHLSELIGVGRSTLREALKTMNFLGFIEVRHGDGTYLRKLDTGFLTQVIEWALSMGEKRTLDLMEARHKLEVDIVELAAIRRTDEEIEQLRDILSRMKAAGNRYEEYVEADIAFHVKLAEISRNMVLRELMFSIQSLLRAWITSDLEMTSNTDISFAEHTAIFQAVENGDPRVASVAMEIHMTNVVKRVEKARAEGLPSEDE